jgi:fumarylpyruvate hydrolase
LARYLFDPPPTPSVPVDGLDVRYPVLRIFCVGRNYEEHAKEMGLVVDREKPFYFAKSATTLRQSGATLPYPPGTENYHFEMELVVATGAPAFRTAAANAPGGV